MNSIFSLPPSKVKECVETCMKARLVPFIQSSPGLGKSSIIKELANEYRLKLIDCRLSSMEPTDLQGLPWIQNGKAQFNPYDFFPIESSQIPKGYEGWLLFLDEFNSASRATQASAYRVVLDREVGMHKLHPNCFVVAAGNKMTDNAIVNRLSTAMISRVIHLNMEVKFEDWVDNFALPNHIDERVIAYLSMYPDKLMDFDPEREDQTFASPRTWEFVSKLIKASGKEVTTELIPLISGAITLEQASAFVQFCKVYSKLVSIDMLKKDPNIDPPKDSETIWATLIHLINRMNKDNLKIILPFLKKLPSTFQIVFFRSVRKMQPDLFMDVEIIKLIQDIGNYCYGTSDE